MATKTNTPDRADPKIEADRVVEDLAKIAFANILDFAQVRDGDVIGIDHVKAREAGAKASIVTRKVGRGKNARTVRETTISLPKKVQALIRLGKHLGLFESPRKRKTPSPAGKNRQERARN